MAARDDADARAPGTGRRRTWSVRLRLTVLTAGLLCLTLAVGALALTTVLSRARVGAIDDSLRQQAGTVAALVDDDRVPRALPVGQTGQVAQVLDRQGAVVASSATATRTLPVLDLDALPRPEASDVALLSAGTAYDAQARVAVTGATWRGEPVLVVVTQPLEEVQRLLRALGVALGAVVPVLTVLLAWAIWAVLGRALRPVEQMRRAAAEVARTGGPGSLPVPSARDEIGALAETLNEMLDRLERAAGRQRAFVGDAAHELRSPLAALRAQLEVGRSHPDAYPTADLLADLEAEVLRLQALVDDLLLLARVGSAPRHDDDVDLAAVARAAVDVVRLASPDDTVAVEVHGTGGATGDPAAVGRVVRNLVENAVRHARARVVVRVGPGEVAVEDDGPGVPAADRERVFERFVRLDEARDRGPGGPGGTGLGLAIAREVARDQGGDVRLGEAPTGGLRAVLTLRV